jgi:carboxyl-terminal processing protease
MNKTLRYILLTIVTVVLVLGVFGSGFVVGNFVPVIKNSLLPATSPAAQSTSTQDAHAGLQTLFQPFWQAWDLVHQEYVDQPVDDTKLMEGAIKGMMDSLGDPHSGYWTPKETNDAQMAMQGEYDGIGALVDVRGDYLTITKPMPGYPAEQAGLLPGDQITAVDGQDMTGQDPDLVRLTKVMGVAGTQVRLTILREGLDKPFDVTITRAHIVVPSVTSKMLEGNIAYIQVTIFGDNTTQDFHDQLAQLMAQNPSGLILDLRDNGGGYLDSGIAVASEFIGEGVIVYERYGDGTQVPHNAIAGGLATSPSIPLVVLVNGYTASASEIVSGAIQDTGRGKLVGELTYGKGSVQNWNPLEDGGTARVTIAKWLTPNGTAINKVGLTPDVVVPLTNEDIAAGKDPQLDAAVQALMQP